MKDRFARLLLIFFDTVTIYLSIVFAYYMSFYVATPQDYKPTGDVFHYANNIIVYILVIVSFYGLRIYKHRHDFWEETYLVMKSLVFSFAMLLALIALSKNMDDYSRTVVILSFIFMLFLIPTVKYILKKKLLLFGLWDKKAFIVSENSEVVAEIFGNAYLGYVGSSSEESDVVFVDTAGSSAEDRQEILFSFASQKKEIIFIPILKSFNYANAGIIEIFNSRTNLIVLENALLKPQNIFLKQIVELFLSILLIPFLVVLFTLIILKMKREEPKGSIFFKQDRLGKDGEVFVCYKFRSMREDGDEVLSEYLKEHPEEVENYSIYHKYENDPRITKIGDFLRRTSLDELPQIINVFKGEMSLIGPRPYMLNEKEKIGKNIDMVLAVKPGISGLWQVSGRSNVDFYSRIDMDVYYTRNWNLWLDVVIFFKTIKTVLFRDGAS